MQGGVLKHLTYSSLWITISIGCFFCFNIETLKSELIISRFCFKNIKMVKIFLHKSHCANARRGIKMLALLIFVNYSIY
jgi:hypothetical protein